MNKSAVHRLPIPKFHPKKPTYGFLNYLAKKQTNGCQNSTLPELAEVIRH